MWSPPSLVLVSTLLGWAKLPHVVQEARRGLDVRATWKKITSQFSNQCKFLVWTSKQNILSFFVSRTCQNYYNSPLTNYDLPIFLLLRDLVGRPQLGVGGPASDVHNQPWNVLLARLLALVLVPVAIAVTENTREFFSVLLGSTTEVMVVMSGPTTVKMQKHNMLLEKLNLHSYVEDLRHSYD